MVFIVNSFEIGKVGCGSDGIPDADHLADAFREFLDLKNIQIRAVAIHSILVNLMIGDLACKEKG